MSFWECSSCGGIPGVTGCICPRSSTTLVDKESEEPTINAPTTPLPCQEALPALNQEVSPKRGWKVIALVLICLLLLMLIRHNA